LTAAALEDFFRWREGQGRPSFTRAAVQAHRAELEHRGYSPSTINQRLAALEAYWENRNNTSQILKQQLLYNLWKVSNKWLELKRAEAEGGGGSELFYRRKEKGVLAFDEFSQPSRLQTTRPPSHVPPD
jgi:hypothetical protein